MIFNFTNFIFINIDLSFKFLFNFFILFNIYPENIDNISIALSILPTVE